MGIIGYVLLYCMLVFHCWTPSLHVLVSMSWCQAHVGTCDQILLPVGMLLSCFCGAPWWEDGSAICSAITQWPEWRRTHNHTLLSHLDPPPPNLEGQVPVFISPRNSVEGTGFPFVTYSCLYCYLNTTTKLLRGLSPRANYTDWATANCRPH
jgi:hypothetical protein